MSKTQIGGKYCEEDASVFALKQRFLNVGVDVSHPLSDRIWYTKNGRGYNFDVNETTFLSIETDYYRSLRSCDFHVVNNRYVDDLGYVGRSASLEMMFAMLHRRPILLMHEPRYASGVDRARVELLHSRRPLLHVTDVDTIDDEALSVLVSGFEGRSVDYGIDRSLGDLIRGQVSRFFDEIRTEERST